jgi:hypothetical protein
MSRFRRRRDAARSAPAVEAPIAGVNLLSPWVLDRLRVRAVRKRLGYGLAALVVLTGGVWVGQQLTLRAARADLAGEVAVGEGLQSRIEDFAPVQAYVAEVQARSGLVHRTMAVELSYSTVLAALDLARPPGTEFDEVTLELPEPEEGEPAGPARGVVAACPGPDPFATRVVVGCVRISGTAPSRAAVSELVRKVGENRLFVEPFVDTTTTRTDEPVTFTGSVGLSPWGFTRRFDAFAGPAGEATP